VAAYLEPEILIVDEVLAVGDAEFQKKCLGKMDEVSRNEGRTVLFVSHSMGAIQKLCGKSILFQDGRLKEIDKTQKVISTYLNSNFSHEYRAGSSHKKEFWFKRIFLTSSENEPKSEFLYDEKIYLNFDVGVSANERRFADCNVFFMVLDHLKNRIFCSDSPNIKFSGLLTAAIDGSFLVRGNYSIHAIINRPGLEQIDDAIDVCNFTVIDNGSSLLKHNNFDYGSVFGKVNWLDV
jgi:lipopolysaccharide transport system ATP-binding protein